MLHTLNETNKPKTMKKISLQTKLEDCSVPQRYIDAIKRGSEDVRTIYDILSSKKYEFEGIRGVGKKCLWAWEDFLKAYGLHIAMTVKEILQYEPNGIIKYYIENGKLYSKFKVSINCNSESNIDREQGQKFDPKMLKHFDKVLARDLLGKGSNWICSLFSHYDKGEDFYPCYCAGSPFSVCIPYNDETKHLAGTNEEAPEYYRYWED